MNLIHTEQELQHWITQSLEMPVVLFKHSTRCPISSSANDEMTHVEESYRDRKVTFAKIHVVEDRTISLACADVVGIKHESPQVIILNAGRAVWNDSHYRITVENLEEILSKLC